MPKYLVTLDYEVEEKNPDAAIDALVNAFAGSLETGIINEKLIVTVGKYVDEEDTREGHCKILKFKAKKTRH